MGSSKLRVDGRHKAPWHLWVVGLLAVVWNGFGAYDYIMTVTEDAAYLHDFSAEQLDFFRSMPDWVVFFWALAVWSGFVAACLLLLRSGWASVAYGISLAGMAVSFAHNYLMAGGAEIYGVAGIIMTVVLVAAAVGQFLYARAMQRTGYLR